MHPEKYGEDYFLRGKQCSLSLYENYRWLPDLTLPMAKTIAQHCGFERRDTLLDFGCARGYLVKALAQLGYDAYGTDVSRWALNNCDEEVQDRVGGIWPNKPIDWVIAKDVLEHIETGEIVQVIERFGNARKGIFVVVPLSHDGSVYVVPEYDLDVTHVQRMGLYDWAGLFYSVLPGNDWEISMRYRIRGIKDNYAGFERGNGFIVCKRIGSH